MDQIETLKNLLQKTTTGIYRAVLLNFDNGTVALNPVAFLLCTHLISLTTFSVQTGPSRSKTKT